MRYLVRIVLTLFCLSLSTGASAALLSVWGGWNEFETEDTADSGNYYLDPGYGGQAFDAERLFYKVSGSVLSIGLQTGFSLATGHQLYSDKHYYAGDLALSFNGATLGDDSTYEFGVDFGLRTKDYSSLNQTEADTTGEVNTASGSGGIDDEGFYAVSPGGWNNNVYSGHHASDPFAIDEGLKLGGLLSNTYGFEGASHYRMVSFDIGTMSLNNVDVHWTMSCGNDAINGHFSVPEPSLLSLLGFGLIGLGFIRRRKAKI